MPATDSLVLIADDDPMARRVVRLSLNALGCRIESVENGGAALRRARDLKPDLILLDVNMPDMDGYDVCKSLRADSSVAEVPIMMLTALTDRDARLRGIEAGADDFISKPFDQVELAARVRTVLRLNRYRHVQDAQRLSEQIEMAATIQKLLMPSGPPRIPRLAVVSHYRPAARVGGDYYDFIMRDEQLYFVVGDVSGHSLASALFVSSVRSTLRALLLSTSDVVPLAEALNARIVEDAGDSGMFVTIVVGRYDLRDRSIVLVNCGHPEPVILRRDHVDTVPASATPIGMLEPLAPQAYRSRLAPGDLLCLSSDGLIEAANPSGELFGTARFRQVLEEHRGEPLDDLASSVFAAVETFTGSPSLEDDVTLVMFRQADARA